jgi:hypothetical protein
MIAVPENIFTTMYIYCKISPEVAWSLQSFIKANKEFKIREHLVKNFHSHL